MAQPKKPKPTRGFAHAGGLVATRVRRAGGSRGFSETRILTNWVEIVGPSLAAIARPAKVSYAKSGFGATLTVITQAAYGPELQMQVPTIRERVNACYGYNAISRVRITQVDKSGGLAEPAAAFAHDTSDATPPDPQKVEALGLDNVKDEGLRAALEQLSTSVLTRTRSQNR